MELYVRWYVIIVTLRMDLWLCTSMRCFMLTRCVLKQKGVKSLVCYCQIQIEHMCVLIVLFSQVFTMFECLICRLPTEVYTYILNF